MRKNQFGFTLIELVLVMAIASILLGFITFNLVGEQKTVTVDSTADTLVSDMASQQNKAMLGQTAETAYGIYFQFNKYILFKGSSYNPNDSSNFTINLDKGYSLVNNNFTNSTLVFSAITGTFSGYLSGHDSIGVQDSQGFKIKTIKLNRYGVVILEN